MAEGHVVDEDDRRCPPSRRHGQRRGVQDVEAGRRAGEACVPRPRERWARQPRGTDGPERRQGVVAFAVGAGPQGDLGPVAQRAQSGDEAANVGADAPRHAPSQLLGDDEHLHGANALR